MDDIELQRAIYESLKHSPRGSGVSPRVATAGASSARVVQSGRTGGQRPRVSSLGCFGEERGSFSPPPQRLDCSNDAPQLGAGALGGGAKFGRMNRLQQEGILPRSARQEDRDLLSYPPAKPHERRTDWGEAETVTDSSDVPLKRFSDSIPGWSAVLDAGTAGRVQRQNTEGTHILFAAKELGPHELSDVHQNDVLLLRSDCALSAAFDAMCVSALVHHLGGRGHDVLLGIGFYVGKTPSDDSEGQAIVIHREDQPEAMRESFPAVVIRYGATGGVFLCVERWVLTRNGRFKRVQVLEQRVSVRLQRDRVALSIVVHSNESLCISANDEVVNPAVPLPGLGHGKAMPVLFCLGGKVSVRDLSVAEGSQPPESRVYQRPPPGTLSTPSRRSEGAVGPTSGRGGGPQKETARATTGAAQRATMSPSKFTSSAGPRRREATNKSDRSAAATGEGFTGKRSPPSGPRGAPQAYIDPDLAELIKNDIMERSPNVDWDDVVGIPHAKELLKEAAIFPALVPELFTGIVQPWKGILLFGPPGTGKTMLARAVATTAKTTFFNVSTAQLLSKNYGESEKLVRTLFQLARQYAPSTVFFDEIDALMAKRGTGEHEASRRVKSEMLQQIDGLASVGEEHIIVLATTNHPWDVDSAMRRRLEKRIYIPLPDQAGRIEMLRKMTESVQLDEGVDLEAVARGTDHFSGADMHIMIREAAMAGVRRLLKGKSPAELVEMKANGLLQRGEVTMDDFLAAMQKTQPSVSIDSLAAYEKWFADFGSA